VISNSRAVAINDLSNAETASRRKQYRRNRRMPNGMLPSHGGGCGRASRMTLGIRRLERNSDASKQGSNDRGSKDEKNNCGLKVH